VDFKTQLIHKEWPEARPRKKPDLVADRRRGSFDLVVLAPSQLQRTALEQFIVGRINAPIVIEPGLNYGKQHLTGDRHKLANSARSSTHTLSTCHGCHRVGKARQKTSSPGSGSVLRSPTSTTTSK
jgi:hypothetical protein